MLGARLLALAASHTPSCGVSLLRLSLLIEELGLQEVVGVLSHELIGETGAAVLHAILLVGLLLVLLRHLELHIGSMLLGLLL